MTDHEIDILVRQVRELSDRMGGCFVLDHERLLNFRCAQREQEAVREQYRKYMRELNSGACG